MSKYIEDQQRNYFSHMMNNGSYTRNHSCIEIIQKFLLPFIVHQEFLISILILYITSANAVNRQSFFYLLQRNIRWSEQLNASSSLLKQIQIFYFNRFFTHGHTLNCKFFHSYLNPGTETSNSLTNTSFVVQ